MTWLENCGKNSAIIGVRKMMFKLLLCTPIKVVTALPKLDEGYAPLLIHENATGLEDFRFALCNQAICCLNLFYSEKT